MDGWTGLYNLRARKRLEELQDRPMFENLPPMKFEFPEEERKEKPPELMSQAGQLAAVLAKTRGGEETKPIWTEEEEQPPGLPRTDQLATAVAGARTGVEEKNPYAFWKTSVIGGKEGKEGLPLDRAVALAGMLASSFAPQEWGGRMGAQIAQYAKEGSKAHEEWEAQKKTFGLKKEELGLAGREVAVKEREAARPTQLEVLTGEAGPEKKETYLSSQERLIKAGQQPNETMILSGALGAETAKTYAENKRALEQPQMHPILGELYQAQIEAANVQADKYRQDLITDPLNAAANRKLANAQAERMLSEKAVIDEGLKAVKGSVIGKLPKETQTLLTEIDKAYNNQISALEKQYTAPAGMGVIRDYKKESDKLNQLAEWTNKHAVAANAVVPQYPGTAANIEYFSNQVQRYLNELYKPIAEKKVGWLGGGAKQKEDVEQRAITLMKQVVELHRKFPGTPSSFALARQYQDALNLLKKQEGK